MAEIMLRKIKSRFSLLVIEVQKSMASLKVDASIVEQFLLNYFEGDCDIPEDAGLSKIFKSVTKARLWRYDHYGPLEELAESFLPEDDPARVQVSEYKSQLTGFQATTRIIDFVKLNELEDREQIPGRLLILTKEVQQPLSKTHGRTKARKRRAIGVNTDVYG